MIPIVTPKPFGDVPKAFAVMHDVVRDQAAEGVKFMSQYPAKPGDSRYKRTGTLRRSWAFKITSGNNRIEGEIGSNANVAPYNEEVQGADQNPFFKAVGWKNVEDLGKKIDKEFPERMQRAIDKAFT